MVGITLMLVSV